MIITTYDNEVTEYTLGTIGLAVALDGSSATLAVSDELIDLDAGLAQLRELATFLSTPQMRALLRLFERPPDDAYPDPAGGGPIADWLRAQFGLSKLPE